MNTKLGKAVIALECMVLVAMLLYCGTEDLRNGLQKIEKKEVIFYRSTKDIVVGEAVSKPRVVKEEFVIRQKKYFLSDEEYENLLKIVEAEATGEDFVGKMLVANVVMNRVNSEEFPDNVTEVIFDRTDGKVQFSPVADGRINRVRISNETKEAVQRVIYGEDVSDGALYFVSAKRADPSKYIWFTQSLDYLFTHGGHEFYR